jgi:hypothetical protein
MNSLERDQSAAINPLSYHAIKKCPKCHSPFVDQFCDSCGFKQTSKNNNDVALGEDFYQIKDEYMDARSPFVILMPALEKMYHKRMSIYLLKVRRRIKTLIELMIKADFQEGSTSFKTLYQLEFYDALNEIAYYQRNISSVMSYPERVYRELKAKNVAVDSQGYSAMRELVATYQPKDPTFLWQNMQLLGQKYWREMKLLFICTGSLAILVGMAFYTFKLFN